MKQLMDWYDEYKTLILKGQQVLEESVSKHGIGKEIHIKDKVYKVKDFVERLSIKDAPSNIVILGRYIIISSIFDILDNIILGNVREI